MQQITYYHSLTIPPLEHFGQVLKSYYLKATALILSDKWFSNFSLWAKVIWSFPIMTDTAFPISVVWQGTKNLEDLNKENRSPHDTLVKCFLEKQAEYRDTQFQSLIRQTLHTITKRLYLNLVRHSSKILSIPLLECCESSYSLMSHRSSICT